MSLTSYRAAPPRVDRGILPPVAEKWRERKGYCGPGGALLFRTLRCSTIGAEGFHGRVRDGIGCLAPRYGHQAGKACPCESRGFVMCGGGSGSCRYARRRPAPGKASGSSADRAISTGQLRGLLPFHLRPIDVVV